MQEYSFTTSILKELCADCDNSDFEVVLEKYMRRHTKKKPNDMIVTKVVVNRNPYDSDEWVKVTAFTKVYEFDKGEVQNADTK